MGLEKKSRRRGLRCSTSHLDAKDTSLEEAKKEWLVDRLVCFELHWHDKEQERAAADAAATKAAAEAASAMRKSQKKRHIDDIDGEAIEDMDGLPLTEADVDGEP